MPTTTTLIPVFATIGARSPVIHNRYGRGTVQCLFTDAGQARVLFDDDGGVPRRVQLRDLVRQPNGMPANRPELVLVGGRDFR